MSAPARCLRPLSGPMLALLVAACGVAVPGPSGTPQACPAALLGPVTLALGPDGISTLAMSEEPGAGNATPLHWPDGYGIRPLGGGGEIVDERGEAVARMGERVWLGGGFGADDGEFFVCGEVMHQDPAG